MPTVDELAQWSLKVGDPMRGLAILAEGNTSCKSERDGAFWVKASGHSLAEATAASFCEVRFFQLLQGLELESASDDEVRQILESSKVDADSPKPSVEAFMHAWLLRLLNVNWVIHTHPEPLLPLLCLPDAENMARQRIFPDEIVCCGPAACFVPYIDPGIALAKEIASRVFAFVEEWGQGPNAIWLANHGLITCGATAADAWSATLMSLKAAKVWLGALQTGLAPQLLSQEVIARIMSRPDEHYRKKLLAQVAPSSANIK